MNKDISIIGFRKSTEKTSTYFKKIASGGLLLLLMLSPMTLSGDTKIGYIDSNKILEEYRGKNELKQKLEKELAKWQEEAMAKKQKIESSIKEFDSQSLMLSEKVRLRKRQDIEKLQLEYEAFIQKIWGQEGLAKQKNVDIMKPFIDKVNLILKELGEKEDYTIVFDVASTGVVYTKEGLDLTEKVISELNIDFAPITSMKEDEKTLFWVFAFEELTREAREYKHGTQISGYIKAGFVKTDKFKAIKSNKLSDAMNEANIGKKEEDFTVADYAKIGKFAGVKLVVTGEVTRVGDKVNITCQVIDVETTKVIAKEIESSSGGEREDLVDMADRIASKLLPRITE